MEFGKGCHGCRISPFPCCNLCELRMLPNVAVRTCSHESVVMLRGCCGPRILPFYGHVFFEPILMNPVDLAVGHGCPSELRRATGPILSGTCGAWCWMKNNHGPRSPSRKLFGQLVY